MRPIILQQPQRIVFGTGCISQFCDEYTKMNFKRLFILTAPPIVPLIESTIKKLIVVELLKQHLIEQCPSLPLVCEKYIHRDLFLLEYQF